MIERQYQRFNETFWGVRIMNPISNERLLALEIHHTSTNEVTSREVIELIQEIRRLKKENEKLWRELHKLLDFERWAETKGYGLTEYLDAIEQGEWNNGKK